MQPQTWDDLRIVLALARAGTLAGAAARLRIDATTVGRRLRAAEASLGARLFERAGRDGVLRPTPAGAVVVLHAERVESEVAALRGTVSGADAVASGSVRLTSVPILVSRVLVPAVPTLAVRHPGLRLDLIAEPRDLSLTRRDADLALRLARPSPEAGQGVLARRIGRLAYAAYAPAEAAPDATLPWIGYEDGMAGLPPARWIAAAAGSGGVAPVALNDGEAIIQAVRAGLGRSLLPRIVGDREPGLRRIATAGLPDPPSRELWLLVDPDLRPLARIAAVIAWIEEIVAAPDMSVR